MPGALWWVLTLLIAWPRQVVRVLGRLGSALEPAYLLLLLLRLSLSSLVSATTAARVQQIVQQIAQQGERHTREERGMKEKETDAYPISRLSHSRFQPVALEQGKKAKVFRLLVFFSL